MTDVNSVIQKHNSKIMKDQIWSSIKTCKFHWKTYRPINGNCFSEGTIYKASIETTANKSYYCTFENKFKERENSHTCYFRNEVCEETTKLSNFVWKLKKKDINYFINWDISMISHKYVCRSWKGDLCILIIARADLNVLLNKRDGLVLRCQCKNRFTLMCFKDRYSDLYYFMYAIILVSFLLSR